MEKKISKAEELHMLYKRYKIGLVKYEGIDAKNRVLLKQYYGVEHGQDVD